MTFPVETTFKDLPVSPALETWIREWAHKLEHVHDRITRCDVVVATPHRHNRHGRQFHVGVRLQIDGADEVVVSNDPGADAAHEDPYVAVRDSFRVARRQLQDLAQRRRGE